MNPESLEREEIWDPHLFCGPGAQVALAPPPRANLAHLGANCVEGLRHEPSGEGPPTHGYDGPYYRQANLGTVRFRLEPEHWSSPTIEGPWCVEPGDVVLNKLYPVRASWAAPGIVQHPADANCILIKWEHFLAGRNSIPAVLERRIRTTAYWIAVCLNQPAYEEYLLRRSGAAILPRIRLAVLRDLDFPLPPEDLEPIAGAVWEWQGEMLANDRELTELESEVERHVAATLQTRSADGLAGETASMWSGFFPAEDVVDSLVPKHVVFGSLSRRLHRDQRWTSLGDLVLEPGRASRARVGRFPDGIRILRLSDVGRDLFVPLHIEEQPAESAGSAWRVFAEPLRQDEVLFSLLSSSPRVAFTDGVAPENVYVTDHWERLDFRDTPGAWALVLTTEIVRRQMRLLAMGTFQQFALPESVRDLVLPPIDYEVRLRWDDALRRCHKKRAALEAAWDELWAKSLVIFDRVHAVMEANR